MIWLLCAPASFAQPKPGLLSSLAATEAPRPAATISPARDSTSASSRIYFDVLTLSSPRARGSAAFKGSPLGRLVFRLSGAALLPQHSANVRMLCTGLRIQCGISLCVATCVVPRPSEVGERTGCAYSYSWCRFEPGAPKTRGHQAVLRGKGRNAVGRSDSLISDDKSLSRCERPLVGGGAYYGVELDSDDAATDTVLAVPVRGAGKGTSRLSFLTGLAGAPEATRRRLLLDQAVIGVADGGETAEAMHALLAGLRERKAVAVSSCGELFENGSTSAIRCMFVPAPEEDLSDDVPPAS